MAARRPWRAALAAVVALWGGSALTAAAAPPQAVATVGMIGDVAERIAGECVEVETLMGPGIDPHLYQASSSDVRLLQRAEAILYAGYALEGQLGAVLAKLGERKPAVAVSEAAARRESLIQVGGGNVDPHLWMDPQLWADTTPAIAEALAGIAPDCAAPIRERAAAYRERLAALDEWIAASIATIPERQRVLITAHDAFGYYGRAYGLEVRGIQGISTDSEAGIADIRRMVSTVVERRIPAVFIESTINPRTVEAVVDAAGRRGHELAIGGELYSDALGSPGSGAGTYISMLRSNTETIVRGLGGEPAPWPEALPE
ncbi:metal ABC transporter solute-binding protein, Zn/Mn family [Halorhodospira neutriphila]|uniref:Manganese transporter n=1 Tax=Halorhodospira neutriphila TaxID=168379 RepID=A0ABS1E725_9GAMM|nr:zinc ABC transporter substrate-binding protein [Halorhodospira neutriphila]MBK1727024.1 manganese transporter [Halorhodospira neutriphila]